jgi:plasmid stabilization system protein ParE
MKLRFTPRAAQDLAAIADYIRARNPAAAQRVRAAPKSSFVSAGRQKTDRRGRT